MDLGLKGQTALVLGASRGLGLAVARALGAEGANIALCARQPERVHTAAEAVRAAGAPAVLARPLDVTDAAALSAFVAETHATFGRLDILITNAGGPRPGRFVDLTLADWETATRLTLLSAVAALQAVVPLMRAQHSGSIVVVTSYAVKTPIPGLTLSNAVRVALIGLTKTLADELGPDGIRVNATLPGWTHTERVDEILAARAERNGTTPHAEAALITREIPLGRMADPEEFARAVTFLASPAASYITGTTLAIDGGIIRATL